MRVILTLVLVALAGACSEDGAATSGRPQVVVTTTILGDVVGHLVGDDADVTVLLPRGADPHEFAASASQAEAMAEADLLVVNGAGFEASLVDLIDAAAESGTPLLAVADVVDRIGHDPHVWMDPRRMATATDAIAERLAAIDGVDGTEVEARATSYRAALADLDAEVDAAVARIPDAERVLVTNHEVLAYFADRYGFEVIGTVIPSLATGGQPTAAELEALGRTIREARVPAIFVEATTSARLAEALASTLDGSVTVVRLDIESLGRPGSATDSYVGLLRTTATRIVAALT